MGVVGEILIVRPDQVTADTVRKGSDGKLAGIAIGGLEPVKLATLHTILIGEDLNDVDAVVSRCPPQLMEEVSGTDGPWLFAIPDEVTAALAKLEAKEQIAAAKVWANTEEWSIDSSELEGFAEWFGGLCEVAKEAVSARAGLVAWISL